MQEYTVGIVFQKPDDIYPVKIEFLCYFCRFAFVDRYTLFWANIYTSAIREGTYVAIYN